MIFNYSINKLTKRFRQFKSNRFTSKNPLMGMIRYFYFNIYTTFFSEYEYNWIGGLKLLVKKGDAGLTGDVYFLLDDYEESILLLHLLNEDDLFLDIGANLGRYSILLSGIKRCKSIAIEPVPNTFHCLNLQIEANKLTHLVQTLNIGISDQNGVLRFTSDKGTMNRIVSGNYKNSIDIKVENIDTLLQGNCPAAIKIDVEGYEKNILLGADSILRNSKLRVIIIELNASGVKYGTRDEEIVDILRYYNFFPVRYQIESRTITELVSFRKDTFNTIFIRNSLEVENLVKKAQKIKIGEEEF